MITNRFLSNLHSFSLLTLAISYAFSFPGYLWQKFSCSNSLGPQAEALIADPYFNINPWSKFFSRWQNHQLSVEQINEGLPVVKAGHPLYNKAWLKTFFLDVSGSFFACVVAIGSSFIWLYASSLPYYHLADPALAIVVVIFVVGTRGSIRKYHYTGLYFLFVNSFYSIVKDTMLILLQTLPHGVSTEKLGKRIVNEVDGILSIHELHVWQLTSKRLVATVHITISKASDYMKVASAVKHIFHQEGIHSLTLQPEFIDLYPEVKDGLCLVDCSAKPEEDTLFTNCASHQCCQDPIAVFPDSSENDQSFNNRSLANPPGGIPMIDATAPNTPYVDRRPADESIYRLKSNSDVQTDF